MNGKEAGTALIEVAERVSGYETMRSFGNIGMALIAQAIEAHSRSIFGLGVSLVEAAKILATAITSAKPAATSGSDPTR